MATELRHGARVAGVADAAFLDAAHAALDAAWLAVPSVDDEDRMLFGLAVAEVAANIIEHGTAAGGGPPDATLELEVTDDELRACFRDTARIVDLDVDAARMPDADAESGRGLALTRAALHEFRHEASDGNLWLLLRRRS